MSDAPKSAPTCVWTRTPDAWDTTCGVRWPVGGEKPGEPGMRYCPLCGRRLEVTEDEGDER